MADKRYNCAIEQILSYSDRILTTRKQVRKSSPLLIREAWVLFLCRFIPKSFKKLSKRHASLMLNIYG